MTLDRWIRRMDFVYDGQSIGISAVRSTASFIRLDTRFVSDRHIIAYTY